MAFKLTKKIHKVFYNACYTGDLIKVNDLCNELDDKYDIKKKIRHLFKDNCMKVKSFSDLGILYTRNAYEMREKIIEVFNTHTDYEFKELFVNKECNGKNCNILPYRKTKDDNIIYCDHIEEILNKNNYLRKKLNFINTYFMSHMLNTLYVTMNKYKIITNNSYKNYKLFYCEDVDNDCIETDDDDSDSSDDSDIGIYSSDSSSNTDTDTDTDSSDSCCNCHCDIQRRNFEYVKLLLREF